jgi:predicted neuraminidase
MEWTKDWGQTWQKTDALNDGATWSAIQPTILDHGEAGGGIQILCRTKQQRIAESWSRDGGRTWTALAAIAALPNPNSGIDAVQLKDGRSLVVYNHTTRGRTPLNVAVSVDGKAWQAAAVLEQEPGEYSYPAVMQTSDGRVHITYTWKRQRIKHVVIDPAKIEPKDLSHADGGAPNQ